MPNKLISDLTLRSDMDDTCNVPVDDGIQTWRVTGTQIASFVKKLFGAKAATYVITNTDRYGLVGTTTVSTGMSTTLPAASSNPDRRITITKIDAGSGAVTATRAGADTIGLVYTTWVLANQNDSITLVSDGGINWAIESISSLATATQPGLVSALDQSWTGNKSVAGRVIADSGFRSFQGTGTGTGSAQTLFTAATYSLYLMIGHNTSIGDYQACWISRAGSAAALTAIAGSSPAFSVSSADVRATATAAHLYQWSAIRFPTAT